MQRRSIAGVPTAIGTPQSICFKHDCSYNEPVSKRSRSQITPPYFVIIYYYTPKSRWQCSRSTFLYGFELGYDLRDSFCREDISSIFLCPHKKGQGLDLLLYAFGCQSVRKEGAVAAAGQSG